MNHNPKSNLFNELTTYVDREEILNLLILQLDKDTGLDYTNTKPDLSNPHFLNTLRKDLSNYIKKIAGQNQTRFMNLIYRVDITQAKLNSLNMDEFYFINLAEMILDRLFQKVITKRYIKS